MRPAVGLLLGEGQICIWCLGPIFDLGVVITQATMTTHAHLGCKTPALRLLGGWAGTGRRVHELAEQEETR